MSEIVDQSLQKIAKGAKLIFIGTIIGMGLTFTERVLVARFFTQAEYGIYSLGLAILGIFVMISLLGLQEGVTRQIAYYMGKNEKSRVKEVIFSSFQIVFITSVILSLILFFVSDHLSIKFSHNPTLSIALKIFAFAIPFVSVTRLFVSIFRGFNRVKERVYFENILQNTLFLLFLLLVILLNLSFIYTIYAFVASRMVTCITCVLYAIKRTSLPTIEVKKSTTNSVKKELLSFSIPLLITTMLIQIMDWTDTLMLGYFKSLDIVGIYNGALPLARLIFIIFNSMAFICVPIVSQLYSQSLFKDIKRIYEVSTKWIFVFSTPIFLVLFLFPNIVLGSIFGEEYISASPALQILAMAIMFHASLGLNGEILMVMGKTKQIMYASLIGALSNIILNIILIPPLGSVGAATASAMSYIAMNIYNSIKLYKFSKIHPFTMNYLKSIVILIILLFFTYIFASFFDVSFQLLPIISIVFLLVYILSLLLSKGFDKEDVDIILAIEKRLGLSRTPIANILKRFL